MMQVAYRGLITISAIDGSRRLVAVRGPDDDGTLRTRAKTSKTYERQRRDEKQVLDETQLETSSTGSTSEKRPRAFFHRTGSIWISWTDYPADGIARENRQNEKEKEEKERERDGERQKEISLVTVTVLRGNVF